MIYQTLHILLIDNNDNYKDDNYGGDENNEDKDNNDGMMRMITIRDRHQKKRRFKKSNFENSTRSRDWYLPRQQLKSLSSKGQQDHQRKPMSALHFTRVTIIKPSISHLFFPAVAQRVFIYTRQGSGRRVHYMERQAICICHPVRCLVSHEPLPTTAVWLD